MGNFKSLVIASKGGRTELMIDGVSFSNIAGIKFEHIAGDEPKVVFSFANEHPQVDLYTTPELMTKRVGHFLGIGEAATSAQTQQP